MAVIQPCYVEKGRHSARIDTSRERDLTQKPVDREFSSLRTKILFFSFFLFFVYRETYEIISWNFNGITRSNNLINFALQSCATTDTMFEIMDSVDGRKVYVQGPVSDS